MPGIMEYYSEDAIEYIGRMAYIPTNHPTFIWRNHVLCQDITPFRFLLWSYIRRWMFGLDIRQEPSWNSIMKFKLKTDRDGDNEDNLEKPLFMATFDALWFHRNRGIRKRIHGGDAYGKGDGEDLTQDKMTWWEILSQLVLSKFLIYSPPVIECHDLSLEFLDNPAIIALVTFKWETIGFVYWSLRFFCQCIYYILVVTAALAQVYSPTPSKLYGVFVAIIIIGLAFIFLEILQAIPDFKRYIT
ncbi:hypothetical protein BGZ95_003468 [Linnemannia exigua]|uniref:Uncharacterized protein n=1 Tax=Linnemannia exigua TaxID=604196 RepID=A0AAD4D455_9FUNG|nr:hypothetical protein BGZ95_003468 [Linnemannia exigua]